MFHQNKMAESLPLLQPLMAIGAKHAVSSVFVGIGRLVLMLVIASLVMFLVRHSGDICRRLIACLASICVYVFEPSSQIGLAMPRKAWPTLPRTPRLPVRFQLPPPVTL